MAMAVPPSLPAPPHIMQAMVLVVLVGRLLQHASFQPRLAIIAGAIKLLLRDLPYLVRGASVPSQGPTTSTGLGTRPCAFRGQYSARHDTDHALARGWLHDCSNQCWLVLDASDRS
jgi:hypothetical protein